MKENIAPTPAWFPGNGEIDSRYFPLRALADQPYLTGLRKSLSEGVNYTFHRDQWRIVDKKNVPACLQDKNGHLYLISVPFIKKMDLYSGGKKLPLDSFYSHMGLCQRMI